MMMILNIYVSTKPKFEYKVYKYVSASDFIRLYLNNDIYIEYNSLIKFFLKSK